MLRCNGPFEYPAIVTTLEMHTPPLTNDQAVSRPRSGSHSLLAHGGSTTLLHLGLLGLLLTNTLVEDVGVLGL